MGAVLPVIGHLQEALASLATHGPLAHAVELSVVACRQIKELDKSGDTGAELGSAHGTSSSSSSSSGGGSTTHSNEALLGNTSAADLMMRFADLCPVAQALANAGNRTAHLGELLQAIRGASTPAECLQLLFSCSELRTLPQALQAAGRSLCGKLPLPWLCNNPDCTNMAGISELQLVGGSSCVCGACRVARSPEVTVIIVKGLHEGEALCHSVQAASVASLKSPAWFD